MEGIKGWNGITLFKKGEWHIRITSHAANGVTISVESPQWADHAIYYPHNGLIAWDFPERIPKAIRFKAEKYLRDMRKAGTP